jgi:hypothetical protein
MCKLCLYILIFNKTSLVYDIVSLTEDYLSPITQELLSNTDPKDILQTMFRSHVNLNSSFVSFVLADISNTEELFINYYCLIPYNTSLIDSYLIPINTNDISSPHLRKIFSLL